jgi:hypothetical protein
MQPLSTRELPVAGRFTGALSWRNEQESGDDGTRTHDPLLAKQVLFQLSYIPLENCL